MPSQNSQNKSYAGIHSLNSLGCCTNLVSQNNPLGHHWKVRGDQLLIQQIDNHPDSKAAAEVTTAAEVSNSRGKQQQR